MLKFKTCKFEGCDRPAKSKGLCDTHYGQQRRGKVLTPIRSKRSKGSKGLCSAEGCKTKVKAKGLCDKHYTRKRLAAEAKGDTSLLSTDNLKQCHVIGCTELTRSNHSTMCEKHHAQMQRSRQRDQYKHEYIEATKYD